MHERMHVGVGMGMGMAHGTWAWYLGRLRLETLLVRLGLHHARLDTQHVATEVRGGCSNPCVCMCNPCVWLPVCYVHVYLAQHVAAEAVRHERDALREHVQPAEVVQQPAVDTGLANRRLHRAQVEHGSSFVTAPALGTASGRAR